MKDGSVQKDEIIVNLGEVSVVVQGIDWSTILILDHEERKFLVVFYFC